MLFDLGFFIAGIFLIIPAVNGYYALACRRSFWLWFALGLFFPIVSGIVLLCLPDKRNPIEDELTDLRLKLGLLGTHADDAPSGILPQKAKAEAVLTLRILTEKKATSEIALDFVVGDQYLLHQLQNVLKKQKLGHLQVSPVWLRPSIVLFNYLYAQAEGKSRYKVQIATLAEEGSPDPLSINVHIKLERKRVVWQQFYVVKWDQEFPLKKIKPLYFNRLAYAEEVSKAEDVKRALFDG